jgi:GT2 family glycosyltransferase/glycosyltransferase involved in cell wall biosynthesis
MEEAADAPVAARSADALDAPAPGRQGARRTDRRARVDDAAIRDGETAGGAATDHAKGMRGEEPRTGTEGMKAPRTLAVGAVEALDHRHVLGWAWYRPTPDEPIDVEILVDDLVVLRVCADQPRPELAAAGAGDGRHGFHVEGLDDHIPPGTHTVRVRRARDRLDLPGSPRQVECPDPDGDAAGAEFHGSRAEFDGSRAGTEPARGEATPEWESGADADLAEPTDAEAAPAGVTDFQDEPAADAAAAADDDARAEASDLTPPADDAMDLDGAVAAEPASPPDETDTGAAVVASEEADQSEEQRHDTPARPALPVGAIDSIDHSHILGWAWYRPTPDEPIDVEVLVDDVVVVETRAELPRPELAEAGAGNGRHGFFIHNFSAFFPAGTHTVRVRRARDRLDLPGSPVRVSRLEEGTPDPGVEQQVSATPAAPDSPVVDLHETPAFGNVDRVGYEEVAGWVWDPEHPDTPVDIEILDGDTVVLKVCADRFRPDLADAGMGSGHHGFAIPNLGGIFSLSRHLVRVRRAVDGWDLPGSPAWITRSVLDEQAMHFIDEVVFTAIEAATRPEDLSEPLAHLLTLLNDLINVHERLARMRGGEPRGTPADAAGYLHLTDRTRELVDQLRYAFAPLYFEPTETPEVSVIIPVHNQFAYTYECLKSILAAPPSRSFEIIIVDDWSDDETLLAALVFAGAVRIVRNTKNLGFVRTCNAGAALARGKYLFFLNNDTLVKPGWLDELVETFEQVPNIGIAGSKLLFADGKLQEAGGIIWRLGDGWNWGRGRDPDEPGFSYLRDADWVSGAALMIERTLFDKLKGFDEYYAPAYYEDTDLAFRVRALGKRVVVQPASVIVHLEGVSAGTDTSGPGMKRFQVINHAKFYRRWKDTLITHRFNGQQPEQEAERLVTRRAYFIDDTVPTPDQDAGSNAAVEHMRALLALGYKVTFLPADNMANIPPYTANLQKLGIECLYHPWFWSVEEVFRKAAHKPDLVYLHRYSNASKYATMVRRYFPACRVVYNVADLHFLRMQRQAEIDPASTSAAEVAMQRRGEIAVMRNVDSVIVHSPAEAALLLGVEPEMNVKVVPWTVLPRPTARVFAERSGTAFVGGFGHPPNADAVRYMVSEIVPLLRPLAPDCTVYLVGSKMPDALMNLRVPGVRPLGFIPVLADILHKLRCTVVPLRYGAGIKGKVLESFAHGLPCVMSEVAAEGLELPEDLAWLVARSPAEFAEKLARVHQDEAFNRALSVAGWRYITRRHSAETVTEALKAAVEA